MGSSFFGDPLSFALFCGLLIGIAILIMKFSNFIGSFTAIGATLLCPIISPFWNLISRISDALPTLYSVGSPITVVFALAAACFSWWRIGSLVELLGWESAMETLMEGSAVGFLITVFSGEAFDGFTDISYIFTSGLNALLMATLAHAFLAALVERGDWILFPLQLLYGVIFVVFCICLGTYLPSDLGFSVPEQWWTMAQIQLPELSLGADLLQETWGMLQLFLDLMMRAVVIYLVCIGVLMMITNLLSTFACGLFALVVLTVAAGILETVCPDVVLSAEVELAFCVIMLLIPEIILLNWDPSDDGTAGPSFSDILEENAPSDYFIHPYAAIFGGFMGGPFVWLAVLGVFLNFTGGFNLYVLMVLIWVLFLYAVASIPAILSLIHRGNWDFEGITGYLKISVLWIPLIMLVLMIFFK